jgi:hypothetical protein
VPHRSLVRGRCGHQVRPLPTTAPSTTQGLTLPLGSASTVMPCCIVQPKAPVSSARPGLLQPGAIGPGPRPMRSRRFQVSGGTQGLATSTYREVVTPPVVFEAPAASRPRPTHGATHPLPPEARRMGDGPSPHHPSWRRPCPSASSVLLGLGHVSHGLGTPSAHAYVSLTLCHVSRVRACLSGDQARGKSIPQGTPEPLGTPAQQCTLAGLWPLWCQALRHWPTLLHPWQHPRLPRYMGIPSPTCRYHTDN